jgi:hypothetical protein
MQIVITPSDKPTKKFEARIDGRKSIHFGAKNMSDFTIHKDPERKQRYLNRHSKNEDWNNYNTAAFYATNILWNKPTIAESISDTNRRFPYLHIVYKN